MEKDKSRGVNHRIDKKKHAPKKYQKDLPQATQGSSHKNKPQPRLGSNWDRYAEEETEPVHKLTSSTDYSLLAKAPITSGSHFQFKRDKMDEDDMQFNNQFDLNLDLLHRSLQTIPYYKLIGIDTEYFENSQIEAMDKEANQHLIKYKAYLESTKTDLVPTPEISAIVEDLKLEEETEDTVEDQLVDVIDQCHIEHQEDDLNYISEPTNNPLAKSSDDLEQWLDEILDD